MDLGPAGICRDDLRALLQSLLDDLSMVDVPVPLVLLLVTLLPVIEEVPVLRIGRQYHIEEFVRLTVGIGRVAVLDSDLNVTLFSPS